MKKIHATLLSIFVAVIIWASISLSNSYVLDYQIPISFENLQEGFSAAPNIPSEVDVKVKCSGWKHLGLLFKDDLSFTISVKGKSNSLTLTLNEYLADNSWVTTETEIVDITPPSIHFAIERARTKQVPIVADLHVTYKEGYGPSGKIILDPPEVLITGPKSVIDTITHVTPADFSIENISENRTIETTLKRIHNVSFSPSIVRISIPVQQIVDKIFTDVSVILVNDSPGSNVLLRPDKISVTLRGGIDLLTSLTSDSIRVIIKYADIEQDSTGSVFPEITAPMFTTVLDASPPSVGYIFRVE